MGEDKAKWPDVDGLIQAVGAGFVVENDVIYDAREAFTELVRGFTDNVALFRDGWAAAQVAADNAPYRPGISVCFNCGPVDVCDEDKCCVSCGRDLIDVQGDVSVDVLTDAADELRAERDAAVARAEAAEAALAAARAEGAAAERAKAAATLRFRAKVMRERKAFGIAEEVDALAFYIEQRGVAAQAKVGCTCADIDPRQRPCAHCDL